MVRLGQRWIHALRHVQRSAGSQQEQKANVRSFKANMGETIDYDQDG